MVFHRILRMTFLRFYRFLTQRFTAHTLYLYFQGLCLFTIHLQARCQAS